MSRSGYIDDCDGDIDSILAQGRYIAALKSAINGKRGQQFLRELIAAMDAMPVKELVAEVLVADGQFCALGVVGAKRGIELERLDPEDPGAVGTAFDISESLAREVVYQNDEAFCDYEWVDLVGPPEPRSWYYSQHPTVQQDKPNAKALRWQFVRDWAAKQIKATGGAQ